MKGAAMNGKQRVRATLNHREPDRLAIDFGGTPCTGIHALTVEKLRRWYGLDDHPVRVVEALQMLGEIEEDLREVIGSDVVALSGPTNIFGFERSKPWGRR